MKKSYTLVMLLLSLVVAHGQSGMLDPTFGNNGMVTTPVSPDYNIGMATTVQPDGKILVVGYAGTSATYTVAVIRYNQDGSLDNSFGDEGKLLIPVGAAKSYGADIALQNDGKIVIAARTYDNVSGNIALIRLNTDGSLDTTFGTNGIAVENSGGVDIASSILIDDDGKIYVGGDSDQTFAVSKFNTDGSLDTSFGVNGWTVIPFVNTTSIIEDMAFQEDGKIVLAGFSVNSVGRYQMTVARINTDGSLDSDFAATGQLVFNVGVDQDLLTGVGIQSDGKIILGGHSYIDNIPRLQYDFAPLLD